MNMRNKVIAALLAFLMLCALIGCSKQAQANVENNSDVILQNYTVFLKNFEELLAEIPEYTITYLPDVSLDDGTTCHILNINDTLLGDSYRLRIDENDDNGITWVDLSSKRKATNHEFMVFSYYLYKSMDFSDLEADIFYDKFNLFSKEKIYETTEVNGYNVTSMTIDSTNQITFVIQALYD